MNYTLEQLDMMEGHDFEYAVAELLRYNGWRDVEVTQGSGDYGIDILARRMNVKYAIQCKRYNKPVGNSAVQQAAAGADYYHCDAAAVITNNTFTKQAENMAGTIGVKLWGREFLIRLIQNYDDGYGELYARSFSMDADATNSGISKICPMCGRKFLNSSFKCPVCDCSLVPFSAQKGTVRTPQKGTPSQKKQKVPQTQIQKHTQKNTIAKKKNSLQQQKPSILSIIAIILSFLGRLSAIGIILAIIDLRKKDGHKKLYSVFALVIGFSMTALFVTLDNHRNPNENQEHSIADNYNSAPSFTEMQSNKENITPKNTADNIELGKEELIHNALEGTSLEVVEFSYLPEDNYTVIVIGGYTSGFTNNQNIKGTYFYIREVLESLQPIIDTDVSISVKAPVWDAYGNANLQDVIFAYYTLETIQKINFEVFNRDNIPVIADYWEDTENYRIQN